ncbi:hypothetical protein ACVWW2_007346 [Bradyrhizobium sp. LM4.3]
MRKLFDLVDAELGRRNLVGIHAGAGENGPKEREIGAGPSDDADLPTCQIGDLSDFPGGLFLGVLARSPGGRPQHDVVLPKDCQRLRVGRHCEVAATDCQVGFAGAQQAQGFGRSPGRNPREPDGPAFLTESIGHRFDHLMVVAS